MSHQSGVRGRGCVVLLAAASCALGQKVELRPAEPILLPGFSDSNSPAHWWNDTFFVIQSAAMPMISRGGSQSASLKARAIALNDYSHTPLWIESTWVDDDGSIYAWYHHEVRVCGGRLAMPEIGALVSRDGGFYFYDLGIVLRSGYPPNCAAANGYFAGGHGDFTVLLDPARRYFYFYFSNYGGFAGSQGICTARLAFSQRNHPAGRARKFHRGAWREPGLGGRVTPMLPAAIPWDRPDTDAFWGPSLHWNSFLNQYVMLLNRSCCAPGWPSEGIYASFNPDLASVHGWTPPRKILASPESGWYPQVIGLDPGQSDKQAGKVARFYISGDSHWEIVFNW